MPSSVSDLYRRLLPEEPCLYALALGPSPHFLVLSQAQKTCLRVTAGWSDLEGWAANG